MNKVPSRKASLIRDVTMHDGHVLPTDKEVMLQCRQSAYSMVS